jgi:hypothetical protein
MNSDDLRILARYGIHDTIINWEIMRIFKIPGWSGSILLSTLLTTSIYSQAGTNPANSKTATTNAVEFKYGALAIDRDNGFYYGFAVNATTLTEAVKSAIAECKQKGGKCTLVLSYSGAACVAYRTSAGENVGLAYGWGIARTREEADAIAKKECTDRTFGMAVPNLVFSCNDSNLGGLNIIYNASREIDFMMGIPTDY